MMQARGPRRAPGPRHFDELEKIFAAGSQAGLE
jgi:hypothetical protein